MPATPGVRRWGPPVLLALLIGTASLIPVPEGTASGSYLGLRLDILAHLVGYAALGITVGHGAKDWRLDTRTRVLLLLTAIIGYGVMIEGIQAVVPTRHPSLVDILANALGTLLGLLVAES